MVENWPLYLKVPVGHLDIYICVQGQAWLVGIFDSVGWRLHSMKKAVLYSLG